jgi:hypothetical protein
MGTLAGTTFRWLAAASLSAMPFIGIAASQSCDGLAVEIGAGERRCLKLPGYRLLQLVERGHGPPPACRRANSSSL